MKRTVAVLTIVAHLLLASGCGTLISGTTQKARFNGVPVGADVKFLHWDGKAVEQSAEGPTEVRVHRPIRNEPYLVSVSKPGYCPKYWLTKSTQSGGSWSYLWLLFIPALGPLLIALPNLLVDQHTGGCCSIDPDQFEATLSPEEACPEAQL